MESGRSGGDAEALRHQRHKKRSFSKKDRKRMSNYFTEYCNATSIHGFRYLGERKRSFIEKLWWFITIVISVTFCGYLIILTYYKWDRSPVIVSFATKQTPIWQIPFPAVTICPETKSRQSVFNYTALYLKKFSDLTYKERQEFEYISLICNPHRALSNLTRKTVDETILNFFDDIAPRFTNLTLKCVWNDDKFDCGSAFTPILTDAGVCYTFNMLSRDELFTNTKFFKDYQKHPNTSKWSLDKGYARNESKDTYPRRALFSGTKNGLFIEMVSYENDIDYICGDSLQGYKILLHHPAEMPRVSQQYFRVPLNQAVVAAVRPDMMTTSDELLNYKPSKRQCFFPHERKMRFFKVYTQQNCEIECLTNFTLKKCGCVDFHMPRTVGTPICGPAKIKCMQDAEKSLHSGEIEVKLQELEDEESEMNKTLGLDLVIKLKENIQDQIEGRRPKKSNDDSKRRNNERNCNCLLSCASLSYNADTSQSDWNWVEFFRGMGDPYGFVAANYESGQKLAHLSRLVLFFKDSQFIASERDELYGDIDFLANCGGLLGLFTGFSFISLVEIIYFLSLRLCCNIRLHGRCLWGATDS